MRRNLARSLALPAVLVCVTATAASGCSGRKQGTPPPTQEGQKFTLFVTTDLRGTIEPCGCTTDPLGDIARTAELIDSARRGKTHVIYLDGGSSLYSNTEMPPDLAAQEDLKADLLAGLLGRELSASAVGLGPYDLARGPKAVRPPRQAANVPASAGIALAEPTVLSAGDARVGIFGVVSPALLEPFGITAEEPTKAATRAVAELRKRGAQVVVALAHMSRNDTVLLSRAVDGIDFAVVGQTSGVVPLVVRHEPEKIENTWLIEPADRGQVVSRLDITIRPGGGFTDAIGPNRAKRRIAELGERVAKLSADVERWRADEGADPAFLKTKEAEIAELKAEKSGLEGKPLRPPEKGGWFVLTQVEVKKQLPCNESVREAKSNYDQAVGKKNLELAKGKEVPKPGPGKPGYTGVEACAECHEEAVEFWKKTKHHEAWKTLELDNKQFNLDCISCHLTGWDEPGGANLARYEPLRAVQCEVCHGPGSLHVDAGGADEPRTIVVTPEETTCKRCHNEEHSDTFQFEPYLRDVTGPGHGEEFRKRLGDGPTGLELRRAGLEKAGKEIGEGCKK